MEAQLVSKDAWEVIDESVSPPMGSLNSKPVKTWLHKQNLARSQIILHVEPSQIPHIRDRDPRIIWNTLKSLHRSRGFASRLALRRRFVLMKKSDSQSMQSWIADVRRLAFELKEIGVDIADEDIILVLTTGLPPSYVNLIVTLDAVPSDDLDLDYVTNRLLNEESRQIHSAAPSPSPPSPPPDSAAYVASSSRRKTPLERITCFKCQQKGHYQSHCPNNIHCTRCKGSGHVATQCPSPDKNNAALAEELDDYTF